ncbi:MAG: AAA family ATPase [Candidatus Omnitrophica bacterium]|nr:AAA family ATPase [Candidatus Omnitrophota bacterium]
MYEEYWGLKEKPFENTPDPKFLYLSKQHEEGLSRLLYVVKERKGAGILTGVFGCGKTVLAQALLKELSENIYRIALINNPHLKAIELLRAIGRQLGAEDLPQRITEMSADFFLELIEGILLNNTKDGKETLLIIDEAHIIKDEEVLEELRLLLNFQSEKRFLLTLLLLGQPELSKRIQKNKQLVQRIAMGFHLTPLNKKETKNYIIHRLNVAQRPKPVFSEDGLNSIYENSGGIPRRINQICDIGLLTGFSKKVERIDKKIIQESVDSLGI